MRLKHRRNRKSHFAFVFPEFRGVFLVYLHSDRQQTAEIGATFAFPRTVCVFLCQGETVTPNFLCMCMKVCLFVSISVFLHARQPQKVFRRLSHT